MDDNYKVPAITLFSALQRAREYGQSPLVWQSYLRTIKDTEASLRQAILAGKLKTGARQGSCRLI